jgi:hypothetical protein
MKYYNIELPRCLVVLTDSELNQLLLKDPQLFQLALKRGKQIKRAERFE